MPASLNLFDTYTLVAILREYEPVPSFFRDRYFPTSENDIFASEKVLVEYQKGDQKMAPFVSRRAGDIPMEREGYQIHEYEPPYIAPSRLLTLDELNKRGFGEAIYAVSTPAQRAARLLRDDLGDMDRRITRREEWMAVQTMINNSCTMQAYIDDQIQGETLYVKYFDASSDHTYTVANVWNGASGDFFGDVRAMCRMLSRRGMPSSDLVLGADAADAILEIKEVRELLNKQSGIIVGEIDQKLTSYPGVSVLGVLNFGGHRLTLICADETYVDDSGVMQNFFPATSAMVTAPGCGSMRYGWVSQMDYGSSEIATHTGTRIPKFSIDQDKDQRKLRLASRPLAAPKNYCPYIYAANVVS